MIGKAQLTPPTKQGGADVKQELAEPISTGKQVGLPPHLVKRRRMRGKSSIIQHSYGGLGVPSTMDLQPLGSEAVDKHSKATSGQTNTNVTTGGVVMPTFKTPASGRPHSLCVWMVGWV